MRHFFADKIRIDFNKNTKFTYYIVNILRFFVPNIFYKRKLKNLFKDILIDYTILQRVNYYNKINEDFLLDTNAVTIENFIKKEKKKTYYFDLLEYLRYFDKKLKISYLFGDIKTVPETPSFVKSRPIQGNNQNAVLMKLNKIRHFIFVNDKTNFEDKKDILVWRGKCYTEPRQKFIQAFYDKKFCNVGQTNTKNETNVPWQKKKMKLHEQLKYKFILAIEGNDVASNLKWVMSSNSLAFMPKPTYETWFMEGKLIPNYHYVLLKDDLSNIEDKVHYYSTHIEEALDILSHAQQYITQFQDKKQEDLISLLVLQKYLKNSQQI